MMARRSLKKGLMLAALGAVFLLHLLLLPKNRVIKGYLEKLEQVKAGRLTHPNEIVSPSEEHINIGMIMVTLEDNGKLSEKFKRRVANTLDGLLSFSSGTPLHFIILTEKRSAKEVGGALAAFVGSVLAMRVIQPRSSRWWRKKALPNLQFSFVDMREVVAANGDFVKALAGRKVNKKGERYVSDLFYMAPIYHQAFTKLSKLLVIDSTDLTIVSDIKDLWEQFEEMDETALMSMGRDLSPHYMAQLTDYRRKHPGTKIGEPGRLQGLNTGVVLYRLDRMRQSPLYSSYLHPEALDDLMRRYNLEMSLAEQDWFTALSFAQPSFIGHLPCKWNTQGSLEYWSAFKEVFTAYHQCEGGHPGRIKIFHRNGCGPRPEQCGAGPADISEYRHILYLFTFISSQRFWETLGEIWPRRIQSKDKLSSLEQKRPKI